MNSLVRIACVVGILQVLSKNGINYTNPQYWLVCLLLFVLMLMSFAKGRSGD